ncbi:hypothetical protein KY285_019689 [Solanum tuberosum]|nr:hypothetical protein KY284_019690 [Solanum tuberosum]KAH0692592.1 hypothetical protein KY285_019689 [Solanum tuberosum]
MDVKLGFCVLVSLILLVTYGTEARDMAEDNRQQAPEQNSDFNKHMHSSSHHSPCLAFTTDITQLAKASLVWVPKTIAITPSEPYYPFEGQQIGVPS